MSTVSPWGDFGIKDYSKLIHDFGITPLNESFEELQDNKYYRRGMLVGHRDLDKFLSEAKAGKTVAILSGIKPSGIFHIGSMITAEQMIYFQKKYSKTLLFYSIADLEAYVDNGQSLDKSDEIAVYNVADMLALGMDPDRAITYKQSSALAVSDLAFIFSDDVTFNMLVDIYGERKISLYFAALIQAGDIFLPETKPFNGPKPVLVPVGADQDPHLRLARDLATKHRDDLHLIPPSAVYHKLVRSLTGEDKMSKRSPQSMITLSDKKEDLRQKIMNAFTGGRATIKEQKELGGEPEKCPVFDLYIYFAKDDKQIKEVYDECRKGIRMCGECKNEAYGIVNNFIEDHQAKRSSLISEAKALLNNGDLSVLKRPV